MPSLKQKLLEVPISGLAWATLLVNVIVILQGAFVRASGSGAGCGRSWPTCSGEVLPLAASTETLIEFSHRLLSGGALLLGLFMLWRAFGLRKTKLNFFGFALASFVFLVIEALLGAATVLLELTGDTVSTARGLMVATHLLNSFLLIGALTLSVVYARPKAPGKLELHKQGWLGAVLLAGLGGMLLLMFSGGIAAMGNTMFPSETLREGIAADFAPESHPLIRLRILHPLIAIAVGVYLFISLGLSRYLKPVAKAKPLAQLLLGVYIVQLLIGTLNLALLAPIVLQLLHLATAVAAFALLSAYSAVTLGYPADKHLPVPNLSVKEARG